MDAVLAIASKTEDESDSGRSTPEYLKKYSVKYHFSGRDKPKDEDEATEVETPTTATTLPASDAAQQKRLRTFSETLQMLDDDILAELDVK